VRFRVASDQALLVYLGDQIGLPAHEHVLKLLRLLEKKPPKWLRNVQPAYCSLLVTFDPVLVDHVEVEAQLCEYEDLAESARAPKLKTVEIPVCYGSEFGPDLDDVAKQHGLRPADVIRLHCSHVYHAYFLGFAPGFAYLGDLPDEIATLRLESPRKKVPAGTVGIAGKQTAVYPFTTPGGWRLIGRTPLKMFRPDRNPMELISMGARVRFRPITPEKFREMESP
jgi:KipI family sensor histidine kinase inhibitor